MKFPGYKRREFLKKRIILTGVTGLSLVAAVNTGEDEGEEEITPS